MARMLNKTAHYGTCHPIENSCAFSQLQDGKEMYFDMDGYPVNPESGKRLPVEAAKVEPVAPPAPEADDDVNKEDEPLDLEEWAHDRVRAPWATVQAAVQLKYDVIPRSKDEAKKLIFGGK